MHHISSTLRKSILAALLALAALTGCAARPTPAPTPPMDPLAPGSQADLQRRTEVQLVEQMAQTRNRYVENLRMLQRFYNDQGNHLKANWAQQELDHLRTGPSHQYLVVAEVAGPELRAADPIPQADELYQQAFRLQREATGFFIDDSRLYLAIDKYNELITQYPTSDKIDDAAYRIGYIYHRYLDDYNRALLYYQRVWQWDPQSTLPARFQTARVYDDHLRDRVQALHFYRQAVNLESQHPENTQYAKGRIQALTQGTSPK